MPTNYYRPIICLTIKHDEHRVIDVCIENHRVLDAAQRLLSGKTLEQSKRLIPQLFTLCAQAQAIANQQVCQALTNTPEADKASKQAQQLLALEWLKEHSWQLFLTAQKLGLCDELSNEFSQATLALRKQLQTFSRQDKSLIANPALYQDLAEPITVLLGVSAQALLQFDYAQWQQWLQKSTAPYAKLMRALTALFELKQSPACHGFTSAAKTAKNQQASAQSITASGQGHLHGLPTEVIKQFVAEHIKNNVEQGARARTAKLPLMKAISQHHGAGVISRYFAKMVEMAEIVIAKLPPIVAAQRISPTQAIATVAASRGDLLHYMALVEGKISDYQMLAPTEINFSNTSPLVDDLYALGVENSTKLKQQAELIVGSYDPCVDYQVEVIHA